MTKTVAEARANLEDAIYGPTIPTAFHKIDESLVRARLDALLLVVKAEMPCWNHIRTGGHGSDCATPSPRYELWTPPCPSCTARQEAG